MKLPQRSTVRYKTESPKKVATAFKKDDHAVLKCDVSLNMTLSAAVWRGRVTRRYRFTPLLRRYSLEACE